MVMATAIIIEGSVIIGVVGLLHGKLSSGVILGLLVTLFVTTFVYRTFNSSSIGDYETSITSIVLVTCTAGGILLVRNYEVRDIIPCVSISASCLYLNVVCQM